MPGTRPGMTAYSALTPADSENTARLRRFRAGLLPFYQVRTHPIFGSHGEKTGQSQKLSQNPEIEGASPGCAADRAGTGETAQSRDQPRRSRRRIDDRRTLRKGENPASRQRHREKRRLATAAG